MPIIVAIVVVAAVIVILAIWLLVWLINIPARRQARESGREKVRELVAQHQTALTVRRRQLIHKDALGVLVTKKWEKEATGFWENVVAKQLTAGEVSPSSSPPSRPSWKASLLLRA